MIEVYLDESGTHTDSQIIGVSAVWATKVEWSRWTIEWLKAKSPIQVHHSVDCHNRKGEWEGWTRQARDEYVLRILPVIRDHYVRGVIAAVDKREIARLLSENHGIDIPPREMIRGYYYICLQWAIRAVWDEINSAGLSDIVFIHESNGYESWALEAFNQCKRHFSEFSAEFSFGAKTKFPPLQCADLVAYEGNRQLRDDNQPLRKPLGALDPLGGRFSFRKYSRDEVGPLVEFTGSYIERIAREMG